MLGFWLIIVVIVAFVTIWWFYGVLTKRPASTPISANFEPLINDFNSYPTRLWFSSNDELQFVLGNNPYRYRVMDSNGMILYDNKPTLPQPELFSTVEYVQGSALGQGAVIRDLYRNVAMRAVLASAVRIVHISAPVILATS